MTALRGALETWLDEELPPDSELESAMNTMLRTHGLPAVQFHAVVVGFEVDFLVVGTNIVIECDGWGSHGLNRDQFEYDRLRDAEIVAAGYTTVHITWRTLKNAPDEAADRLRKVIARWAPRQLSPGTGY